MVRTSVTRLVIALCARFSLLSNLDIIFDLLLTRLRATWNLSVLYNKETKICQGCIRWIALSNFFLTTRARGVLSY